MHHQVSDAVLLTECRRVVAEATRVMPSDISTSVPLFELGVDSLLLSELVLVAEEAAGIEPGLLGLAMGPDELWLGLTGFVGLALSISAGTSEGA